MAAQPRRGGSGSESRQGPAPGPGNIDSLVLTFWRFAFFPADLFPHHVESVSGDGGERGDVILDGLVLLDLGKKRLKFEYDNCAH